MSMEMERDAFGVLNVVENSREVKLAGTGEKTGEIGQKLTVLGGF